MNSLSELKLKIPINSKSKSLIVAAPGLERPDINDLYAEHDKKATIASYLRALDDEIEEGRPSLEKSVYEWEDSFPRKWWERKKATVSPSLSFEKGCFLFNLAVMERHQASLCDNALVRARSFSTAADHFNDAQRCLQEANVINKLTRDLRPRTLFTLCNYSSAEAQEAALEAAGPEEHILKASLAAKASQSFEEALISIDKQKWNKGFPKLILAKKLQMAAAAQRFEAQRCLTESETASTRANKRGEAIARLSKAVDLLREASGASPSGILKSARSEIEDELAEVERTNSRIYHERIPRFAELDGVEGLRWNRAFLWEDPDFVPGDSILPSTDQGSTWLRPFEICDKPQFFVDGISRFDAQQGRLGDCWFVAALAALVSDQKAFGKTVPRQDFGDAYEGKFRFNLWWKKRRLTIEIDDRLPTTLIGGKVSFMRTKDGEFWPALLEKAVAKMLGGYQFLHGGFPIDALQILTGRESEVLMIQELSSRDLFHQLKASHESGAIITCARMREDYFGGLPGGHAYTVTGVEIVRVMAGGTVDLIRVRNPWGNSVEWKEKWSDTSEAWNGVSDDEKRRIEFLSRRDGEFWMEKEDFCLAFQQTSICQI